MLASQRVSVPPLIDGVAERIWSQAAAVTLTLTYGRHGHEVASHVTMRSLYTDQEVYFLAEWPDARPSPEAGAVRNEFTMHFDLPAPDPQAAERMCLVACHTAYADDRGQVVYVSADTIPTGRTLPLAAAGGWTAGTWRLEWSRPLVTDNGFDVQFDDLRRSYPFFVKLFRWQERQADPVSADVLLVFQP
jgi:hypothetical protein